MDDYGYVVDDLFKTSVQKEKEDDDYGFVVDDLLGKTTPIPLGVQKTPEISTITTQPIVKQDAVAPQPADFSTMAKAELVRDPQTKIGIYSEARGLPAENYKIDQSGDIVFKDQSGQMRYEEKPGDALGKMKQVAASVVGQPAIPLSTVGAAFGGTPGAVAGAMGGETIRQAISGIILEDPQTVKGNLASLSTEGILGLFSELGGKGMVSGFNRVMGIGKPEGRILASAAKRDFSHISAPEVIRVKDLGDKFGIDLFPPQTTKSRQLIAKMNLLRDLPQTSDIIQAADTIQQEQIQGAIPRYLDSIASPGVTSRDVGEKVTEAAELAIKGLKEDRATLAKPLYETAFAKNDPVDITNALTFLDEKIANAQGRKLSALTSLRNDIASKVEVSPIVDNLGNKIISNNGSESTLLKLHGVKTDLDKRISLLNKPGSESYDNILSGEMKQIRKLINESMVTASPDYKRANDVFALMTPEVQRAEKGLVGVLSGAEEKDLVGVTSVLLSSKYTRPETVAAVKNEILKQKNGQEVWNSAVRDYLEFTFDKITDSQVSGTTNIGGAFRKQIFGNQKQRKVLQSAMTPDQYGTLNDFMTVLERTGLTFKGESTTAIRSQALQDMKDEFGSGTVTLVTQPLQAPRKLLGEKINDVLFARGSEKLAKALISDDAAKQLLKLKQLPKGSEELLKGVTQFLEMTGGEEVLDEVR